MRTKIYELKNALMQSLPPKALLPRLTVEGSKDVGFIFSVTDGHHTLLKYI
jgi:hypothetical protein